MYTLQNITCTLCTTLHVHFEQHAWNIIVFWQDLLKGTKSDPKILIRMTITTASREEDDTVYLNKGNKMICFKHSKH